LERLECEKYLLNPSERIATPKFSRYKQKYQLGNSTSKTYPQVIIFCPRFWDNDTEVKKFWGIDEARRTTPWKINMEATNHPFRRENDLPNLHDSVPC